MYDRKTGSLWVHVTGRAEWGPMKGRRLRFFPATVATWRQWKLAHPGTLVLPGHRRGGFMGTYDALGRDDELGLAVVVAFRGKLYPYRTMSRAPVVNDRVNGAPVVVAYSPSDGTAVAWRRIVKGQELTFEASGTNDASGDTLLRDRETSTLWSAVRGEAVEGRLAGARLEPVSHNPVLVDRFRAFYPDSRSGHRIGPRDRSLRLVTLPCHAPGTARRWHGCPKRQPQVQLRRAARGAPSPSGLSDPWRWPER